jgi:hypothetical protein
MDRPSILKPTLIGGAVFGLLGGLPIISALNVCCCALVMGGGFLAAYLHSNDCKSLGAEFRAGGGAKVGLVAGVFYWLVSSIIQGLAKLVLPGPDFDEILDQAESSGAPPELLDAMEQVFEVLGGAGGVVLMLGASLVLALVFSTIGGLIGGAVFKVAAAPASPTGTGTGTGDIPGPGA